MTLDLQILPVMVLRTQYDNSIRHYPYSMETKADIEFVSFSVYVVRHFKK